MSIKKYILKLIILLFYSNQLARSGNELKIERNSKQTEFIKFSSIHLPSTILFHSPYIYILPEVISQRLKINNLPQSKSYAQQSD